ncbi:hypothetical protein KFE25_003210 [Diacronema lutheri]|uniref:Uncharacterized protein n=1 Tax=Diacronema lutheri TaxID=2081491 RepID=A0A8J5XM02_DIALT|nr:hypothetical protein KFE25_003210 [Diacronema lutheri]
MFSRKMQYEAAAETGALDDLSRKLSGDLRKHVRKLEHAEPLSREWLGMIDSFLHISNIALMEHRLPREDDTATLWEGEELTVRYLLEEGKLNLCIRLMHEYKRRRRQLDADSKDVASAAQAVGLDAPTLEARALVFEQSLSVLLKCAFEHVEPLQTVDMPELIEHVAEVLEYACSRPAEALELSRTQESAVPLYLASLVKRLDALDETRVSGLIVDCALLPRALHYAAMHGSRLPPEAVEALCAFVSGLLQSEDLKTRKAAYLPPAPRAPPPLPSTGIVGVETDAKAELVLLKALLLKDATPEAKRRFAPLVREAESIERLARMHAQG